MRACRAPDRERKPAKGSRARREGQGLPCPVRGNARRSPHPRSLPRRVLGPQGDRFLRMGRKGGVMSVISRAYRRNVAPLADPIVASTSVHVGAPPARRSTPARSRRPCCALHRHDGADPRRRRSDGVARPRPHHVRAACRERPPAPVVPGASRTARSRSWRRVASSPAARRRRRPTKGCHRRAVAIENVS